MKISPATATQLPHFKVGFTCLDLLSRARRKFFYQSPKHRYQGIENSHKVSRLCKSSPKILSPRVRERLNIRRTLLRPPPPVPACKATDNARRGQATVRAFPAVLAPPLVLLPPLGASNLLLSLVGGGNASDSVLTSGQGARGLIRPSSAAGARSSEMAGKFPGKVYQGEGAGRFGKERLDSGDSPRLKLSASSLSSRRPISAWKCGALSASPCRQRFVPPPPTARGSAPSAKNLAPA